MRVGLLPLREGTVGDRVVFSFLQEAPLSLAEGVHIAGPVAVEGHVVRVGEGQYVVTLRGRARLQLACDRCLRPVERDVAWAATQEYAEQILPGSDVYPCTPEDVDLLPLVEETLYLEVPARVLCREECLGLCPRCGHDLNQGPCGCEAADVDPRWEALRRLVPDGWSDKEEDDGGGT